MFALQEGEMLKQILFTMDNNHLLILTIMTYIILLEMIYILDFHLD